MIAFGAACFVVGALVGAAGVATSRRAVGYLWGFWTGMTADAAVAEGAKRAHALFEALGNVADDKGAEAMAALAECTQQLRELGGGAR